jgi:hypothetical protein
VLANLKEKYVLNFMDDLVVYSRSLGEHEAHVN